MLAPALMRNGSERVAELVRFSSAWWTDFSLAIHFPASWFSFKRMASPVA